LNGAFLWRQVNVVVKLVKNLRQKDDLEYAELLARLQIGDCRAGTDADTVDIQLLRNRQLSNLAQIDPAALIDFRDAPIIVGNRTIRDALNSVLIDRHARRCGQQVFLYHSKDYVRKEQVKGHFRDRLWNVVSSQTEDSLGRIPIFLGMKVMITSNLAISRGIVNGAEGTVQDILYTIDTEGRRYASVVYVRVSNSGSFASDLDTDIVPILPERVSFEYKFSTPTGLEKRRVSRYQLPLLPAYSYTDYKSQGRSLEKAIVDLASARSLQGVYVMLSRVKTMRGLAILRWFPSTKVYQRLSEELREELKRVDFMSVIGEQVYEKAVASETYPASMLSFVVDCGLAASDPSQLLSG
jgi:ATP-dependent DNA helicase PIF1